MSRTPLRTTRRAPALALLVALTAACTSTADPAPRAAAPEPQAVTAPVPPSAADPVLVAAGDIACDPADPSFNAGLGTATLCKMAKTARQAVAQSPTAVAVLGDMQYEAATAANIQASYDKSWGALRSVTRPAIGNHEYKASAGAPYWAYFGSRAGQAGKGWYSYELGSWHVVVLNSNCTVVSCAAGSTQERWLRADLAAHPTRCTLAYWHHPRWSSGAHGDNPRVQPLLQALYDFRADVVLAGHDHHYERLAKSRADGTRSTADGIRSFIVGTGGKNLYPLASTPDERSVLRDGDHYGVLRLQLDDEPAGGDYTWKMLSAGGVLRDSGTGSCRA